MATWSLLKYLPVISINNKVVAINNLLMLNFNYIVQDAECHILVQEWDLQSGQNETKHMKKYTWKHWSIGTYETLATFLNIYCWPIACYPFSHQTECLNLVLNPVGYSLRGGGYTVWKRVPTVDRVPRSCGCHELKKRGLSSHYR